MYVIVSTVGLQHHIDQIHRLFRRDRQTAVPHGRTCNRQLLGTGGLINNDITGFFGRQRQGGNISRQIKPAVGGNIQTVGNQGSTGDTPLCCKGYIAAAAGFDGGKVYVGTISTAWIKRSYGNAVTDICTLCPYLCGGYGTEGSDVD